MIDTLKQARDPEGVGLAATQVGLDKRIFILLKPDKQATIYINPQIITTSKLTTSQKYPQDQDRPLEGCLSIPRIWGFVDRAYRIKAKYQTFNPDQSNPTLTTVTKLLRVFVPLPFNTKPITLTAFSLLTTFSNKTVPFLKKHHPDFNLLNQNFY